MAEIPGNLDAFNISNFENSECINGRDSEK